MQILDARTGTAS